MIPSRRALLTGAGASLMEDAARANIAMFERAMQMFPGFGYGRSEPAAPPAAKHWRCARPSRCCSSVTAAEAHGRRGARPAGRKLPAGPTLPGWKW